MISTVKIVLHVLWLYFHQHGLTRFSLAFNVETLPKFYVTCPWSLAEGKELPSLTWSEFSLLSHKTVETLGILIFSLNNTACLFIPSWPGDQPDCSIQPCASFSISQFLRESPLAVQGSTDPGSGVHLAVSQSWCQPCIRLQSAYEGWGKELEQHSNVKEQSLTWYLLQQFLEKWDQLRPLHELFVWALGCDLVYLAVDTLYRQVSLTVQLQVIL